LFKIKLLALNSDRGGKKVSLNSLAKYKHVKFIEILYKINYIKAKWYKKGLVRL
jgi:hypothetical protein